MCLYCNANLAKPQAIPPMSLPENADIMPQLHFGQFLIPFFGLDTGYSVPPIESRDIDGNAIVCLCSACSAPFPPAELVEHSQTSDKLCTDCRSECEECGNVYGVDDDELETASDGDTSRRNHREQTRCESCRWKCDDCSEWFYGDGSTNANDEKICARCAENYGTCDRCSCTVHSDNWFSIEDDHSIYCEECGRIRQDEIDAENEADDADDDETVSLPPVRRSSSTLIHQYTYKPTARFFWADDKDKSREYFGLEIETETTSSDVRHDAAIIASGISTDECLYVKRDGSLDEGFEIVTHPGTFKYWMNRNFSFCDRLADAGYDSFTANCGLHIHVSRSALSAAQIAKLLLFTKQNAKFIRHLSRRVSGEQLDHYAPIESARIGTIIAKAKGFDAREHARYSAINLQNEETIEFRLFQSTLVPQEIRRNIALVAALLAFIRQAALSRLSAEDFRDYLAKHGRKSIGREMASSLIRWIDSASPEAIAA